MRFNSSSGGSYLASPPSLSPSSPRRSRAAVVEKINASGADLLFVAMGSPRQEYWIAEQMTRLQTRFCMGIGGTLDVLSGAAKRAPALFRKTGLEWLFRLLTQPSRLRRQ